MAATLTADVLDDDIDVGLVISLCEIGTRKTLVMKLLTSMTQTQIASNSYLELSSRRDLF